MRNLVLSILLLHVVKIVPLRDDTRGQQSLEEKVEFLYKRVERLEEELKLL